MPSNIMLDKTSEKIVWRDENISEELHGQVLTTAEAESIDIHKLILGQKVKVNYSELASLKATTEEIDTVKETATEDANNKTKEITDQAIKDAGKDGVAREIDRLRGHSR